MSLHDMYFSTKNKNYMYQLISNIIQKETGKNILNNTTYIHHFKSQYPIIFHQMNTDNLSDLNKELLNIVGSFIIQDIQKEYQINNITILEKNNLPIIQESENEKDSNKSSIELNNTMNILSSDRLPESMNRYNYKIQCNETISNLSFHKIEVVKEKNILFSNPTIIVLLTIGSQTYSIDCELQSSNIIDYEYITYSPLKQLLIPCNESIFTIHIQNYLGMNILDQKDMFTILKCKQINFQNKSYLSFRLNIDPQNEFTINDNVGIFENEKCIYLSPILIIQNQYLLTDNLNFNYQKDKKYTVMNMSLQNKISFHYE
jgi:hypothetical protein